MQSNNKNIPIKEWAIDDRPREKAMQKGLESLSDAELIAILIGNGTTNQSALDVAKSILNLCDNHLDILARKTIKELSKMVKGIGPVKAVSILAGLELGRRKSILLATEKKVFTKSRDFAALLSPILADKTVEEFYLVFLNSGNKLIHFEKLSTGGTSATIVDLKIVLKKCLDAQCSGLVIAHNHPSGNLNPSEKDIKITEKIKEGCKMIDVLLTDHIIITNNGYYSFADEGNLL
jgi:DNA repair protein RadC